jgi:hypothetical protein
MGLHPSTGTLSRQKEISFLAARHVMGKRVSLTGIEPVTDGYLVCRYSPPLYQLSYTETQYLLFVLIYIDPRSK